MMPWPFSETILAYCRYFPAQPVFHSSVLSLGPSIPQSPAARSGRRPPNSVSVLYEQTTLRVGRAYLSLMTDLIVLTDAERGALTTLIDGDRPRQNSMLPAIKKRLAELHRIERREWPNGPQRR